jgi:predicted dehydrogenase
MTEPRRWRIGVVGCGEWGPNHIRNFAALPNAEVVGVAENRPDRLARAAALAPGAACFSGAAEMLASVRPDAVVVATPTASHYDLVVQALESGAHVLCEKPLCTHSEQADALVGLADARGLRLMVGHVFLYNNGILKLKEIADRRELGRLLYMFSRRTNLGPIRGDVNAVMDLASHDIAIFNFLIGALPVETSAVGKGFLQRGIEDVSFITLQYPQDIFAAIHVSWLDPKKVREITVVGEDRMAVWDDLASLGPVMVFDKSVTTNRDYADFGEFQLRAREGDVTVPLVAREEPLRVQARAFLEALDTAGGSRADARDGAAVVRILAAINASIAANGAPIRIEPLHA